MAAGLIAQLLVQHILQIDLVHCDYASLFSYAVDQVEVFLIELTRSIENHKRDVRISDRASASSDAHGFHYVVCLANARRVDQSHRHARDRRALIKRVSRSPR